MSKTARDVLKEQVVGPSPGWSIDDAEVDAIIGELDAAGLVIVPKEATSEIVSRSGVMWTGGEPYTGPSVRTILEIYRAMVKAASEDQGSPAMSRRD